MNKNFIVDCVNCVDCVGCFYSKSRHLKNFSKNKVRGFKAQGSIGLVFTVIVAVMVFSLIIFFGYKAISTTADGACKARTVAFVSDLRANVERLAFQSDSIRTVNIGVPCDVQEVCFVDASKKPKISGTGFKTTISNIITTGSKQNVFTDPLTDEAIIVEKLSVGGSGFSCFSVQKSTLEFKLKGTGRSAEVQQPSAG